MSESASRNTDLCFPCGLLRIKRGGIISGDEVWCERGFFDSRKRYKKSVECENGEVVRPKNCKTKQ